MVTAEVDPLWAEVGWAVVVGVVVAVVVVVGALAAVVVWAGVVFVVVVAELLVGVVFAAVVFAAVVFVGTLAVMLDDFDEADDSAAMTAPVPTKVATADVATHLRMARFRRWRALSRMAAFWRGSVDALM